MNRIGMEPKLQRAVFVLWILAAMVAATLIASAGTAVSAEPAKTTLTIKAEGVDLSGTVRSPRVACVGNRAIKLYKQKGNMQNPSVDDLIATDTSEREGNIGEWSTGNTGMQGKFYVRTPKTNACKAGASKTIIARRNP